MADDIARLGYEIDSSQARTAAGDLDKMARAAEKAAGSSTSLKRASANLLRDERGRFVSAQQAANKYGAEIEMLRSKYIPMYAASQRLAASQEEIKRALELGAISSKQASAALAALDAQYAATGNAATLMGNRVGAANANVTNMMFQFQDIGMMLAAGQNPLMLAMQQGTQVAGIFHQMKNSGQGAFSVIKGGMLAMLNPTSLATIAIIAGGAALLQWGVSALGAADDADKLSESFDDLSSSADSYAESLRNAEQPMIALLEKFGTQAQEAERLYDLLARIERIEFQNQLAATIEQTSDQFDGLAGRIRNIDSLIERSKLGDDVTLVMRRELRKLDRQFGLNEAQARSLNEAIVDLEAAQGPIEAARALENLAQRLTTAKENGADVPPELIRVANEAVTAALQVEALSGALAAAADNAGAIQIPLGMTMPTGWQFDPSEDMPPSKTPGRRRGGGGGGGASRRDADLKSFIESLQTEREALEMWRTEQRELLAQFNNSELEAIGGHNEAKLRLEREYSARLLEIKQQEASMVKSASNAMYGELGSLLTAFGDKSRAAAVAGLAINTALRISETIQNTAAASVRALAELGPIAGPPAAARIAAFGKAQIALIAANAALQAGGTGRGGTGGSSAAPVGASTAPAQAAPERIVRISVQGEKWMQEMVEGLVTQIYEASEDGARVIVAR